MHRVHIISISYLLQVSAKAKILDSNNTHYKTSSQVRRVLMTTSQYFLQTAKFQSLLPGSFCWIFCLLQNSIIPSRLQGKGIIHEAAHYQYSLVLEIKTGASQKALKKKHPVEHLQNYIHSANGTATWVRLDAGIPNRRVAMQKPTIWSMPTRAKAAIKPSRRPRHL